MQKDFKTGMLVGLVLVVCAVIWLCCSDFAKKPSRQQEVGLEPAKIQTRRFHIVRKGETLYDIAEKYYGDADEWERIHDANPDTELDKLEPGTDLTIP